MIADDTKKNGFSPSVINCENRWKCLTSSFRAFFLWRQSELFLAFSSNHSYSRIVDKKRALTCDTIVFIRRECSSVSPLVLSISIALRVGLIAFFSDLIFPFCLHRANRREFGRYTVGLVDFRTKQLDSAEGHY